MLPIIQLDNGIAAVMLTPNPSKPRGGVVVLDRWLIGEIAVTIDHLAQSSPRGVILRSQSERVFVAGADLAEIDALDDGALDGYLRAGSSAFARLHTIACPTVALVNKAALGGGLEIAMHCDGIVGMLPAPGDKPWRIGLPECGLGICPGWGGTQMLPARIDPSLAIAQTATGQTNSVASLPSGLVDLAVASDQDAVAACARWLEAHPRSAPRAHPRCIDATNSDAVRAALSATRTALEPTEAARAVIDCVETGIQSGWQAALAAERRHLIALRHTPFAREKLAQFLKPGG